jgi:hypothetical protein
MAGRRGHGVPDNLGSMIVPREPLLRMAGAVDAGVVAPIRSLLESR